MNDGRQHTASTTPSRSAFRSTLYIAQSTAGIPVPSSQCIDAVSTDPPCVKDCIIIANPYQIEIKAQTNCISIRTNQRTSIKPKHLIAIPAKSRDQVYRTYSHDFPTGNNRSTKTICNNPIPPSRSLIKGYTNLPPPNTQLTTHTDYPLTRDLQSMQVLNQR